MQTADYYTAASSPPTTFNAFASQELPPLHRSLTNRSDASSATSRSRPSFIAERRLCQYSPTANSSESVLTKPRRRSSLGRSKSRPAMLVTPEEYEALPESIQKKYFSSVERLRIAQESAAQKRRKQVPAQEPVEQPWCAQRATMGHPKRPKSTSTLRKSASSIFPPAKSTPAAPAIQRIDDLDEDQARRFLALPDKVKRSQFTIEELLALTASCERTLRACSSPTTTTTTTSAVASPVDARHQRLPSNGRCSSVTSMLSSSASSMHHSIPSRGRSFDVDKDWPALDEATSTDESDSARNSCSVPRPVTAATVAVDTPATMVPDISSFYVRRRQGSVSSIYSALPPTPSSPNSPRAPTATIRRGFTRKQAMSLAPLPLPPPRLTPAVPPLPSPATLRTYEAKPSRTSDVSMPSPPPVPIESAAAPAPTNYYKDVSARQKLREYLSSPEKFDEALEFGFPTMPATSISHRERTPRAGSVSSSTDDPGLQTEDDSLGGHSSKYDDGNDTDDTSSMRSPRTPQLFVDPNFPGLVAPLSPHTSLDSGIALAPMPVPTTCADLLEGRQMTLRMTLTRPGLSTPSPPPQSKVPLAITIEEPASPKQALSDDDPLALAALPVCDDHTGAQGAFAVPPLASTSSRPSLNESAALRKVWKTLRAKR